MRKVILILLLLLFTVSAIPAAATPMDELVALAGYLPESAPVFFAIRSDDGFIDTIDGLFDAVNTQFDGQLFPEDSPLRTILNSQASWQTDGAGDFESFYRSWLGDSIALAVLNTETLMEGDGSPFILVYSVTDQAAAETYVDAITVDRYTYYTKEVLEDGVIIWSSDTRWDSIFVLKEGVLLQTGGGPELSYLDFETETTLADSDSFNAALDMLPEDEYNIVGYVDIPGIIEPFGMFAPMLLEDTPFADAPVQELLAAIGPQVYGFTLLDNRSLTMDFVQAISDPAIYSTLGMDMMMDRAPLDMGFAGYIPADSVAVVHDQGLGTSLLFGLQVLDELGSALDKAGISFANLVPEYETEARAILDSFNVNDIATFARLSFRGMTGLTVDEAFGWMNADYANYLRLTESDTMEFSVDGGMLVAVTDAAAAQSTLDALALVLEQSNTAFTTEGDTLVIPMLRDLLNEYAGIDDPALDVLVGMNDTVFAAGTRSGVEFALNPTDGGLAEDPAFAAASSYFLSDPETVLYIVFDPLATAVRAMAQKQDDAELFMTANGLGLLESGSISSTTDADGNGYVRLVLTLKGE